MLRRNLIYVFAGGLVSTTGCLGSLQNQSGDPERQSEQTRTSKVGSTEAKTTESTQSMRASINQPSDEADVGIEAGFINYNTSQEPAQLQIRFTNEAKTERQFRFGSSPPLSSYTGEHSNGIDELVLIPENTSNISIKDRNDDTNLKLIPEKPREGCWRVEDQIISQDVLVPRTLKANESLTETYTVLAGADNEPCISAGKYRFAGGFEGEKQRFNWQLTVFVPAERN